MLETYEYSNYRHDYATVVILTRRLVRWKANTVSLIEVNQSQLVLNAGSVILTRSTASMDAIFTKVRNR